MHRKRVTHNSRKMVREYNRTPHQEQPPQHWRPTTRAQCKSMPRPCPYVGCRYHLFLEIKRLGGLQFPWGDDVEALREMPQTCALDVADADGATLDTVGEYTAMTRERVRQIENAALDKLRETNEMLLVDDPALTAVQAVRAKVRESEIDTCDHDDDENLSGAFG